MKHSTFEKTENIELHAFVCDQITKMVPDLINEKCTILDFGCGNGQLADFMQNAFFKASFFGIDSNAIAINEASLKHPTIHFLLSDNDRLGFENHTFDLVYSVNVFHHINKDKRVLYSKEMVRVLKKTGRIIIFELNPYNPFTRFDFKKDHSPNDTMLPPKGIRNLFNGNSIELKYHFVSRYLPYWIKNRIEFLPLGSLYSVLVHI